MAASIFNGNAIKILKNILRFQDGTELSSADAANLSGLDSNVQDQLDAKVDDTEKGAALGVATLDAGGKVPVTQLPSAVMSYHGTWNASTNTPTLADGTGDAGDVYIVSVAGTQDLGSGNITFGVGDWAIYNGTIWEKSNNADAVVSVNGFTGVVVLDTDDISEGTALYFSDERAQDAVGGILANSARINLTYTDGTPDISADLVANSVDGSFVRLNNNQSLRARNSANSADVDLLKLDGTDKFIMFQNLIPGTIDTTKLGNDNEAFGELHVNDIKDNVGGAAIGVNTRVIYDGSGNNSIDAANRTLIDSGSNVVLDYETKNFYDINGESVLNWGPSRALRLPGVGGAPTTLRIYDGANTLFAGITVPATLTSAYTLVLPPAVASANQVLTDVLGDGVLSWTTISSGADVNLSNLTNTVAIPDGVHLVALNDASVNLGSSSRAFTFGWIYELRQPGTVLTSINLNDRTLNNVSGNVSLDFSNASKVTINQNLIPGTINTTKLGNDNEAFGELHVNDIKDSVGAAAIGVNGRVIYDSFGNNSVDAGGRLLIDSASTNSIGYETRELYDNTGTQVSINWQSRQVYDSNGENSLSYTNNIELIPNSSNVARQLVFWDGQYTETVALRAPNSISAGYILTLPTGQGSNNQTLVNNGGGTLTWTSLPINKKESFTLSSGDVTNGYIDLLNVARTDSVDFVFSGLVSREGVDYNISYTGGSGGVTRINFSPHTPSLVAGDIIVVKYQY